ncbi:863_t:CDS:1, partial [Ambispora gerdemannii]
MTSETSTNLLLINEFINGNNFKYKSTDDDDSTSFVSESTISDYFDSNDYDKEIEVLTLDEIGLKRARARAFVENDEIFDNENFWEDDEEFEAYSTSSTNLNLITSDFSKDDSILIENIESNINNTEK